MENVTSEIEEMVGDAGLYQVYEFEDMADLEGNYRNIENIPAPPPENLDSKSGDWITNIGILNGVCLIGGHPSSDILSKKMYYHLTDRSGRWILGYVRYDYNGRDASREQIEDARENMSIIARSKPTETFRIVFLPLKGPVLCIENVVEDDDDRDDDKGEGTETPKPRTRELEPLLV